MNQTPRYANLRDYLRVLREQRWLIVIVAVVFAGAALLLSVREKTVYQAQASLLFKDTNEDPALLDTTSGTFTTPDQRAALAAQQIDLPPVVYAVKKQLKTSAAPGDIAGAVSAFPEARTNLVVVQAKWGNPRFAASLAQAFAEQAVKADQVRIRARYAEAARILRRQLKQFKIKRGDPAGNANTFTRSNLNTRIAQLDALAKLAQPAAIVHAAGVPSRPVAPRPVRNTLLGLLLGLTLGILAAFVRDSLDRRLRGARDIGDELKLPTLGHVRGDALGASAIGLNGHRKLNEADLESLRIVRANLEFLDVDNPARTVLVTSPLPGEGKSTVSAALATAYAAAGKRTLLVECDLRRPTFAQRIGLKQAPGLTDYLAGRAQPAEVLQTVALPVEAGLTDDADAPRAGVVCITAGSQSPRPAEMLGSERFAAFLRNVSEAYDAVVLDTAPLLSVVDTLELLPRVDAVLVCIRAGQTTRDQAKAAKAALDRLPDKPTGVVITGVKPGDELDYGYYSYSYAYGAKVKA